MGQAGVVYGGAEAEMSVVESKLREFKTCPKCGQDTLELMTVIDGDDNDKDLGEHLCCKNRKCKWIEGDAY